ncbi:MAG: KOW domain-containing RNA-binding protein, partial [Oscillospiraceae bacterium]|nr:KOW domain-containing RNA-binding protein [Oscillospiraceae bacterium]
MEFRKGELVICNAGREKDRLMCVVASDEKYVYVCDGKERLLNNPKRKNPKHIVKTDIVFMKKYALIKEIVLDPMMQEALSLAETKYVTKGKTV